MPSQAESIESWSRKQQIAIREKAKKYEEEISAEMHKLAAEKAKLEKVEELYADFDAVKCELLQLEDEKIAAESRIKQAEIELKVEEDRLKQIKEGKASIETSEIKSHQEDFAAEATQFFELVASRLGLSIEVESDFHDCQDNMNPGNQSVMDSSANSSSLEKYEVYRLTFLNLGGSGRDFGLSIGINAFPKYCIAVLGVDSCLDIRDVEELANRLNRQEISLAKFVVEVRKAFVRRLN